MPVRIKRVYDPPAKADGERVLVDRLWPRGLTKADAGIDRWLKELSPSSALRKWFGHDPRKWAGFIERYRDELGDRSDELNALRHDARQRTVTLLFAAKDTEHNNAVALRRLLEESP
jgi:uncharacterized protein YeaO (DUF488 family)